MRRAWMDLFCAHASVHASLHPAPVSDGLDLEHPARLGQLVEPPEQRLEKLRRKIEQNDRTQVIEHARRDPPQ